MHNTVTVSKFMDEALMEARNCIARNEVPVGAVLVKNGSIVAKAGNRTRELNDPTAHAEILVIREAAQALGLERLTDCDLYVTLEPCAMCAAAISLARIRRLYFGADDPKGGAVENGGVFFSQETCHHSPDVYSGIAQTECSKILQDFFKKLRN